MMVGVFNHAEINEAVDEAKVFLEKMSNPCTEA